MRLLLPPLSPARPRWITPWAAVPPDRASHAIGWSEASRGLGIMIGPVLGGALHQFAGFQAPFLMTGTVLLACAVVMHVRPIRVVVGAGAAHAPGSPMRMLMRSPVVLACLLLCFACLFAIGFLDPALQPFLQRAPYRLESAQVGLVCTAALVAYTTVSIAAGPLASRVGSLCTLSTGMLIASGGLYCFSPAPSFEFPLAMVPWLSQQHASRGQALALAVAALFVLGAGLAAAFVPSNAIMLLEAQRAGLTVEQSSDAIAAISQVAFTAGAAAGPITSGALVDALGFSRALATCALFLLSTALLLLAVVACVRCRRRHKATPTERLHARLLALAAPTMDAHERQAGAA